MPFGARDAGMVPGTTLQYDPVFLIKLPHNGYSVDTRQFQLRSEHIRLCDLLKLAGVVGSGGEGKHLVAGGGVTVDGLPESRKTAKIRAGQTVECRGIRIDVLAAA